MEIARLNIINYIGCFLLLWEIIVYFAFYKINNDKIMAVYNCKMLTLKFELLCKGRMKQRKEMQK